MTPRKKTDQPDDGEQVETVSTDKTSRRRTRELALSCCFEILVGGQEVDKVLNHTIETQKVDRAAGEYLQAAVLATERHKGQLDEIISELAVGWKLDRIARVDLCILRLSISELLMDLETPPPPEAVVINEAVVLAKKFSTEDSGRFVNGILGTVAKDKEKYRERLNPASG
jgi:N utilization substance protein B